MRVLPRDYVYGIIIFTMFLVGGVTLLGILGHDKPTFTDSDHFGTFNETAGILLRDVYENVENINSTITGTGTDGEVGTFGFLDSLVNRGWNILKLLGNTFSFADKAYYSISSSLGVPSWIVTLSILLVVVVIGFSVLSAIFQKDV